MLWNQLCGTRLAFNVSRVTSEKKKGNEIRIWDQGVGCGDARMADGLMVNDVLHCFHISSFFIIQIFHSTEMTFQWNDRSSCKESAKICKLFWAEGVRTYECFDSPYLHTIDASSSVGPNGEHESQGPFSTLRCRAVSIERQRHLMCVSSCTSELVWILSVQILRGSQTTNQDIT